ncbi:MAG: hypothetical protein VKJ02_19845 [Snowella sp.]|nr:hypothetical protein [Snowella sp.]
MKGFRITFWLFQAWFKHFSQPNRPYSKNFWHWLSAGASFDPPFPWAYADFWTTEPTYQS